MGNPPSSRLPNRLRRLLLLAGLGPASGWVAQNVNAAGAASGGAPDRPARLDFPRDHGSHPRSRIEWWYITGHTRVGDGADARVFGFQLTFFRTRVDVTQQMASRFAARQLLFAHAALTDVSGKHFWHDQRIARAGFDGASASEHDADLRLHDWSLLRRDGHYLARIPATEFALELDFTPTQDLLLQGDGGWSRKGPQSHQASHYYSHPQLAFKGHIDVARERLPVSGDGARNADARFTPARGAAWLDHEWSDSLLHADAVGWDWLGINLYDGSTLTAFRVRDSKGDALWDGGSFRHPKLNDGIRPYVFGRHEAVLQAVRTWKSPLTNTRYPVEWLLRTPADHYVLRALMDNQELDSRNSTGAVYWEGLCDLFDSGRQHVGRGYLELTGYARPLVL